MISFQDALDIVLSHAHPSGSEELGFADTVGRVLAADVYSDIDMPPFDKSAMDGFACRMEDLPNPLRVIETIAAGSIPRFIIHPGECARIMTGGMLPQGADAVIIVEETQILENGFVKFTGTKSAKNICFIGEDVKKGHLLLTTSTLLKPRHIPVLAMAGAVKPLVYKQPAVAVIATGSELVEPDVLPEVSQIRNSNAWQMIAQLKAMSIDADYGGIVRDDEEMTLRVISDLLENHQVLVMSGGVSMGDFDFVGDVMQKLGFRIAFNQVSIQPGKPTTFAIRDDRFIFGLPGNPVSAFLTFEILVKPFLFALMGHDFKPMDASLPLASDVKRKKANRMGWIPSRVNLNREIEPLEYHGSAHINALIDADGFLVLPVGTYEIKKGELAHVRFLQ